MCGLRYETFVGNGVVESGGAEMLWEKFERSKLPLITVGDCLRRNLRQILMWTTKSGSTGDRRRSFGLAAVEDHWMRVSGTATAEIEAGEVVSGRGLRGISSDKVWEQLQCF